MSSETRKRPPVIVAHRGASAMEPENTLRAIRAALDVGVRAIELDVRRTKDGELVLLHDETVDRTTDGSGRVADLTSADVRRLDAGKGEHVPTLDEALEIVKGRARLLLELKVRGIGNTVLESVHRRGEPGSAICVSFLRFELAELKRHHPEARCGLLFFGGSEDAPATARGTPVEIVGFQEEAVTGELIERAHRSGLEVLTWTVDDPVRAMDLARAGVEYIASNAPDVLLRALGSA